MFLRVVRGESAGGCVFDVVIMMGLDAVILEPRIVSVVCSSGEVPVEGPVRTMFRDRCRAGVDFEAWFANAAARSD